MTLFPLLLLSALVGEPRSPVSLRESALTPGPRILLADVVVEPDALDGELASLDLGRAPAPGFARTLRREEIERRIGRDALALAGPDVVVVRTETERISGDRIAEEAERALATVLPADGDTRIEMVRRPSDVVVPRGRRGVALEARLDGRRVGSTATVSVDVLVDGSLRQSVPVRFRVRRFEERAFLARDLERGERLAAEDIVVRRVEAGRAAAPDPADLVGLAARRPLRAGAPLAAGDFERPLLVRRRQVVSMVFERGALRVEAIGRALDDGAEGDVVRVENVETGKIVHGTVAGDGLVRVGRRVAVRESP